MKRRLFALAFLLVIGSMNPLLGQQQGYVVVQGIFSLPVDGFAENLGANPRVTRRDGFDVGTGAGFASEGLGVGLEISLPTGARGLRWNTGLMLLINGSDDKMLTQTFQSLLGESVVVEFDYGYWIQMPVMTGFQYRFPAFGKTDFYGMIQGGLSLILPPTREANVSGATVDKRTYDLTRQFGYGLGGGFVVNNKFDLGFRYLDFGEPAFDGTRSLDTGYFDEAHDILGEDVILGEKRPVSMLLLSLGYHF